MFDSSGMAVLSCKNVSSSFPSRGITCGFERIQHQIHSLQCWKAPQTCRYSRISRKVANRSYTNLLFRRLRLQRLFVLRKGFGKLFAHVPTLLFLYQYGGKCLHLNPFGHITGSSVLRRRHICVSAGASHACEYMCLLWPLCA